MRFCQKCNLEYDDKFLFCHKCGSKLQEKIEQNYCPYCGNKIETDGEFCPFCGNSLDETNAVSKLDLVSTPTDNPLSATKNEIAQPMYNSEPRTVIQKQPALEVKDSEESFFSKQHLFTCNGRRGRMSYVIVQTFWGIISEVLLFLTLGNIALILFAELLLAYPRVCNIIKRVHDLNKPTSWAVMLFVLGEVASILIHATGFLAMADKTALYGRLFFALLVCIPFFMLFFKKGTDGPNQYGSDPV